MNDNDPSVGGPAPPPTPGSGSPAIPGAMPLWRLYVVAVTSLCVYLPFWIHRNARQFGIGVRFRRTSVWWALGFVAAPVTACVLYEFNRRATAIAGGRRTAAVPALAYLGVVLLWALTPLASYFVTFFLLAPLPFLMVQRSINRASATGGSLAAHPPTKLRALHWVTVAFGTVLLSAAAWYLDLPTAKTDLARRLTHGVVVSGRSGLYRLTIPSREWRRAAPGTIGDDDSDMELVGPGIETWIVAYVNPTDESDLESSVSSRREMILDYGTPESVEERRFFVKGSDLAPASEMTIDVSFGIGGTTRYVVLTVELEHHVVELLGYTAELGLYTEELRELLYSFAELNEDLES